MCLFESSKSTDRMARPHPQAPQDPSAVYGRLLVGGVDQAADCSMLDRLRVHHIVNCTNNLPNYFEGPRKAYFRVKVKDLDSAPIEVFFDSAVDFIKSALDEVPSPFCGPVSLPFGAAKPLSDVPHLATALCAQRPDTNVLVHCHAGRSRSVTIVLAYMVAALDFDLASAYATVKSARSLARPNNGFWQQLERLELRVRGINSVSPEEYVRTDADDSIATQLDRVCDSYVLTDVGGLCPTEAAAVLSRWPAEVQSEHAIAALVRALTKHGLEGDRDTRSAVPRMLRLLMSQHGAISLAETEPAFAELLDAEKLADLSLDVPYARQHLVELMSASAQLGALTPGFCDKNPVPGLG